MILVGGAPLLVALAWTLRRGAPLSPALTAAFAAVAVGALANVGACAALPHSDDTVTLVWHGGAIVALVVTFVAVAPFTFAWPARERP